MNANEKAKCITFKKHIHGHWAQDTTHKITQSSSKKLKTLLGHNA